MRLDENKNIEIVKDLPSPKRMRVGQLLTSVFGLYTTMDPEQEKLYSEFYHLQSLRKPTAEEKDRFEELKIILNEEMTIDPATGNLGLNDFVGETMNDMISLKIIEQKYAESEKGDLKASLENLDQAKLDEVKKLWGGS